jgi:hypothetical protein
MTSNKIYVLPFVDDHFMATLLYDVGPQDSVATLLDRINNHEDVLAANIKFTKIAVVGTMIAKLERNASLLTFMYGQRFIALQQQNQQMPTMDQIPPYHNLDGNSSDVIYLFIYPSSAITQEKLNEVSRRLSVSIFFTHVKKQIIEQTTSKELSRLQVLRV